MAVIEIPKSSSVSVKLTGPTDPATAKAKTYSVSLGAIKSTADNEKIMNVVALLPNVLDYPILRTQKSVVTTLELDG